MNKQIVSSFTALTAVALAAGYFVLDTQADRTGGNNGDFGDTPSVFDTPEVATAEGGCSTGGNVQVSRMGLNSSGGGDDWAHYGTGNTVINGVSTSVRAYSAASTACNVGCATNEWISGSSGRHPVIAQNFYRITDAGRWEQIGMNWLKHSFCAVSEPTCGSCQGTSCSTLGIGCADTYWATLNGDWSGLGPRSEINPWPAESAGTPSHTDPHALPSGSTNIRGRGQIKTSDVDASQNTKEYAEVHYLTHDEIYDNRYDNASWREVNITGSGINTSGIPGGSGQASVNREPAIFAWAAEAGAIVKRVNMPNDGGMFVGYLYTDNGDGTHQYDYAVFNMNSARAGGSFTIPVDPSATVLATYHHMPFYHSGEPATFNAAWDTTVNSDSVVFSTPQTHSQNSNSSAIRWSSTHTFSITTNSPPVFGQVVINAFTPPSSDTAATTARVPGEGEIGTPCVGDTNGDEVVNVEDLVIVILQWGTAGPEGDVTDNGTVDVEDLLAVILAWGICPPE